MPSGSATVNRRLMRLRTAAAVWAERDIELEDPQVESRPWNQGGQPSDEVLRAEQDVWGAVPKRVLEPVDDLTGTIGGKPIETDGGTGDVATQSLKAITLMGLTGDGGIERG